MNSTSCSAESENRRPAVTALPEKPQGSPARRRVLVIDDEVSISDTIVYCLESEGFSARACALGSEALALAREEPFDLLVLDVGLPDMSGFEVCRRLRETTPVPIIFLTARASEVDRVVGLEIGGDDYLVKPFSPRELSARARAVLRRCGVAVAGGDAPSRAGAFEVDEAKCSIRYRGQALKLSRYEFRLLRLLAKHPGRVFSRAQLMDHAWEEPEASMERTVDSHIKALRAKLREIAPDADMIQTHRGMGYSLSEEA
ncbi:MAG: two-component system response regulator CreB [Verrucomicrobiae bacterium]|nr:two-component system response regulator CreB [Verrucomicrobiae bacterium]